MKKWNLLFIMIIGVTLLPKTSQANTVASPILINKGASHLFFGKDLLVQMTDHSLRLWDTKKWTPYPEIQLGLGNFNDAEGIGTLSDGTILAVGNRGIAPYHLVTLLPLGTVHPLTSELFLPGPDYPWKGWRIFPSATSAQKFWALSPDETIPLTLFSLPATSKSELIKQKQFPVGQVDFPTLSQLTNGSFIFWQQKKIHLLSEGGTVQTFSLDQTLQEVWHLRAASKANQLWVVFSQVPPPNPAEGVQYFLPPPSFLQLVSLEGSKAKNVKSISLGRAWVHSINVTQDKMALLLHRVDENTGNREWTLEIREKDGTLLTQTHKVPLGSDMVTSACEIKYSPDGKQIVLSHRDNLWVTDRSLSSFQLITK